MAGRVNLIPMAGEGKRFVDAGYTIPKPLIPIGDKPMVVKAASCLPETDRWVFVCRRDHLVQNHIESSLRAYFPGCEIVIASQMTEGQACTCLLGKHLLTAENVLTIGACDNSMTYDRVELARVLLDSTVDALIWTFRDNPAVLQNPKMYGYVRVDDNQRVERVSCKIPISDMPMNDHAVIGAFTFKRAGDFVRCAEAMIGAHRRINREFYVDEVMNVAVESGLKVKVFEVQRYICWGTPQDVRVYNYWRSYFQQAGL